MILSFGWTSHLLPPRGCKDTTRRIWSDKTLNSWVKAYNTHPDKLHKAYDKSAFAKGKQIGWLRLKEVPFVERLGDITAEEVAREGHPELKTGEFIERYFFHPKKRINPTEYRIAWAEAIDRKVVVVRFEFSPMPE